ncbi:DNA-directed RNA polymerase III subunit RPC9 isoform 2-T2 [Macrochelys suwanniensis]
MSERGLQRGVRSVLRADPRKDANAALLSNFEVFQLLTDLKQQRKDSGKHKQSSGQQNLNTIMYETLKYISKTPCRFQSPEIVRDFLIAMKGHKLTKAEKLQLLNHRPMSAVEIQLEDKDCLYTSFPESKSVSWSRGFERQNIQLPSPDSVLRQFLKDNNKSSMTF